MSAPVFQMNFVQDIKRPIMIQHCGNLVFTGDNLSDTVSVSVLEDGEPYAISGTVAMNCIRADGATVTVTGSVSGNTASATLTQACVAIPGPLAVVMKVSSDTTTTTLLKAVYMVDVGVTGTAVDPGTIIPDVTTLINAIETAVGSIPADYSDLLETIAPNFVSGTYNKDQYVWNNGTLYRFTDNHSGSWTGTDVESVVIGDELTGLKSAFDDISTAFVWKDGYYQLINGNFYAQTGTVTYHSTEKMNGTKLPVLVGEHLFTNDSFIMVWLGNTYQGYLMDGVWKKDTTVLDNPPTFDNWAVVLHNVSNYTDVRWMDYIDSDTFNKLSATVDNTNGNVSDTKKEVTVIKDQFPSIDGVILPPVFEIGLRYVNNSADTWAINSKRLTFKRGQYISLKQGDVVSIDGTVISEYFGGYSTDGGSTFTEISSRVSAYTVPADGIYFFTLSKSTDFTNADVENGWTYIHFARSNSMADDISDLQNDVDIAKEQIILINGTIIPPEFEIGVRYVNNSADTWATNNKRLSIKRGKFITLKQGDIVSINRDIIYERGGGYSTDNGVSFTSISSSASDYIAPSDGLYFFWISKVDDIAFTSADIENAWKYIRFKRSGSAVDSINDAVDTVDNLYVGITHNKMVTGGTSIYRNNKSTNSMYFSTANTQANCIVAEFAAEVNTTYHISVGDVVNEGLATGKTYKIRITELTTNGNYSTETNQGILDIVLKTQSTTSKITVYVLCDYTSIAASAWSNTTAYNIEAWTGEYTLNNNLFTIPSPTNDMVIRGTTGVRSDNLINGEIVLSGDFAYRNYASATATSIGFILLTLTDLTEGEELVFSWDEIVNPLEEWTTATHRYLHKRNSEGTSLGYAYLTPDNRYTVQADVAKLEFVFEADISDLPSGRWVTAEMNGVIISKGDSIHINPRFLPQTDNIESGEYLKPNQIYNTGNILRRCYNPYKDMGATGYVGQLHCHAKEKVNDEWLYYGGSIEGFCQLMANCGYDFLTITDYTKNGEITHKPSDTHGLVWLCDSQETAENANSGLTGQHMCVYNCTQLYNFPANYQPQDVADVVKADNCACDLAHPSWSVLYQSPEKVAKIKGKIRFCEVYDGLNEIQDQITVPTGKGTDYAWEIMLDNGCVVWGTAVNDSHTGHDSDGGISKGCVKVFASERTSEAIWKALCTGCFIACSRVSAGITSIELDGNTLTIDTGDSGATTKFLKEEGTVVKTQVGTTATYDLDGTEKYVRAVITLTSGETVWTQPIVNISNVAVDDYELTY